MRELGKALTLAILWFVTITTSSTSSQKITTEPGYVKACEKIAREIVMVDEEYNSLKEKYEEVLHEAFRVPLAPPTPKKEVIILGAGIAGLVAGQILQKEGYHVVILEANPDRVGGRIKTIRHEEGQIPPFKDPLLYAEAGAVRIPTSHPLVQTLIDILQLKRQTFYNVDDSREEPGVSPNNTWVYVNGIQKRFGEYASSSLPPDQRNLGFPLPEKYQGKTAKQLLDEAISSDPLLAETVRDTTSTKEPTEENERLVHAWEAVIQKYDKFSMLQFLQEIYPERVVVDIYWNFTKPNFSFVFILYT